MGYIKLKTKGDILQLIRDQMQESNQLEFKSGDALDKSDEKKKREISKDVSSFANSAGGTLLYGIIEANNRAASVKAVNGNVLTKEWLENVIRSNILRPIDGLEIIPILMDETGVETVYVVNIPETENAPHMAADNRYYRRHNFSAVPMEEYEVRQLYFRATKTKLQLEPIQITPGGSNSAGLKLREVRFRISFEVWNVSEVIEKNYKLEIWIPELIRHEIFVGNAVKSLNRKDLTHSIFSISNASPLFPDEKTTIATAVINVEKGGLFHLQNTNLKYKLYFSGGTEAFDKNILGQLSYRGEQLSSEMFV